MKNGFPAPNKKLAINQKQLLDSKSPIQVRIRLSPAASLENANVWPSANWRLARQDRIILICEAGHTSLAPQAGISVGHSAPFLQDGSREQTYETWRADA